MPALSVTYSATAAAVVDFGASVMPFSLPLPFTYLLTYCWQIWWMRCRLRSSSWVKRRSAPSRCWRWESTPATFRRRRHQLLRNLNRWRHRSRHTTAPAWPMLAPPPKGQILPRRRWPMWLSSTKRKVWLAHGVITKNTISENVSPSASVWQFWFCCGSYVFG